VKNGRNYLVYAVLLGLLAAGGTAWYVNGAEAAAAPTESVVVARGIIPARAVLMEDLLTVKKLPKGAVLPDAASTMESFIGKTTRSTIAPGEQILASKLFRDRAESGASFVLPEGRRAVAISVNELIAAGGLIVPGDRVDVIGSCVVGSQPQVDSNQTGTSGSLRNDTGSKLARVAYTLQGLEVLAVAQDVVGEDAFAPQYALRASDARSTLDTTRQPNGQPTAKTITMSLSPDESERLILLENHPDCRLRLALRPAGDKTKATTGVIDFDPVRSMDPILSPNP
jgi:Flp pilus assembly protein CpaB